MPTIHKPWQIACELGSIERRNGCADLVITRNPGEWQRDGQALGAADVDVGVEAAVSSDPGVRRAGGDDDRARERHRERVEPAALSASRGSQR